MFCGQSQYMKSSGIRHLSQGTQKEQSCTNQFINTKQLVYPEQDFVVTDCVVYLNTIPYERNIDKVLRL